MPPSSPPPLLLFFGIWNFSSTCSQSVKGRCTMCDAHNARGPETRGESFFPGATLFLFLSIPKKTSSTSTWTPDASLVAHAQNAHLLFSYFDPTTLQPEIRGGRSPALHRTSSGYRSVAGITNSRFVMFFSPCFLFLFLFVQFCRRHSLDPVPCFFPEKKNR